MFRQCDLKTHDIQCMYKPSWAYIIVRTVHEIYYLINILPSFLLKHIWKRFSLYIVFVKLLHSFIRYWKEVDGLAKALSFYKVWAQKRLFAAPSRGLTLNGLLIFTPLLRSIIPYVFTSFSLSNLSMCF